MSYNKKHFLQRVKAVNEVYIDCHKHGVPNEYIYEHFIRRQYHISRSTFYEYLAIPYSALLKELEQLETEQNKQNPTLF